VRFIFIFLFTFFVGNTWSALIDSVRFEGLTHTKSSYLERIVKSKPGLEYDSIRVSEDVCLLRNLNLFFNVESRIDQKSKGQVDVIFIILEAKYIYPIFSISGFKGQLKVNAGVNHINFLGRAQTLGGMYQYYDRHSFSLYHTSKRHANSKTGHEVSIAKNSTVEPLYFVDEDQGIDTVSSFNFDNYSVSLGGILWLGEYFNLSAGGQYMYEGYGQRDDAFTLPKKQFYFQKGQARLSLEYNKVEYVFEHMEGLMAKVYGEYIGTKDYPEASFLKGTAQVGYYHVVGERSNVAASAKFGLATNNNSPFSPFVLDGFINVRGIGNRMQRGTGELIVNLEYRYSFWRHRLFLVQAAVFSDYGSLRVAGGEFNTLFNQPELHLFTGGGLRFHLNTWYKTCFRVDYSVNPTDASMHGVTFGFGHFF